MIPNNNFLSDNQPQDSDNHSSVKERFRKLASDKKMVEAETNSEFFKRNIGQNAARAAETIVGMPGNFKKAYMQSRDMLESFLPESIQKLKPQSQEGGESSQNLFFNPPTSTNLRENVTPIVAEKIGGAKDYFEPKNEKEKVAGELTQDITSFFMPGTGQMRLAVRLGAPVVGNLTKQGAKYLGADEETAEKAKLGFMLATTVAGQSDPGRFSSNRISQAKQMIPDTATVNAMPLANRLMPLYERVTRGLGVPSKSRAIQGMQDLANQVQNGRIPLRNLMDARDNVNEWISEAGGWDVPANTRDATLRNLNELKTQIITTIEENMASRFPQAQELYQTGYEAAAVNHQSNAISNFIEKNFGRKTSSVGAKLLFPGLAGGAAVLPKTAGVAAATYPIYKTGQILYRIGNSPTLARYYQDVILSASRGNAPAMISNMERLDKELAKEEEKERKPPLKSNQNGINVKSSKTGLEAFKAKFKKK